LMIIELKTLFLINKTLFLNNKKMLN